MIEPFVESIVKKLKRIGLTEYKALRKLRYSKDKDLLGFRVARVQGLDKDIFWSTALI